ncbi:hypothetical protein Salat_2616200 [Sesamum alatum]|uniref:Uncharacterized protein n=1 Tax=Sesamum alatum TaxID=300844 RepID=A0AAE1XNC8_9LAMI|nr:hypothetical protein Salat_2616200 [Sesamum alatum]
MDAQSELYSFLCDKACYCGNDMKDGTSIRFPSPCWVHPLCSKCYDKWGGNSLIGGKCPLCRVEYDGISVLVKLERWPTRGARVYPPLVGGELMAPLALMEHKADCCEFGFEYVDYVVRRFCDTQITHYMHSWCLLTRTLYVDDDSLQRAPPFHCLTCQEIETFYIHDGIGILSFEIAEGTSGDAGEDYTYGDGEENYTYGDGEENSDNEDYTYGDGEENSDNEDDETDGESETYSESDD